MSESTGLTALVDYSVVLYVEACFEAGGVARVERVEQSRSQDMAGMDDGQLSSVQLVRLLCAKGVRVRICENPKQELQIVPSAVSNYFVETP